MTDDGQTVALPLTQETAIAVLRRRMRVVGLTESQAHESVRSFLSAPPEVLAAARGWKVERLYLADDDEMSTVIVLPAEEAETDE